MKICVEFVMRLFACLLLSFVYCCIFFVCLLCYLLACFMHNAYVSLFVCRVNSARLKIEKGLQANPNDSSQVAILFTFLGQPGT